MAIEIEAKAYAKNLQKIEEKILSMGAELVWMGDQTDTYFSHPARSFKDTDEALRVREEEGKMTLTYKGPKIDATSKTRMEINVQVEDDDAVKQLLKKLGFLEAAVVTKHRRKFMLDEFKICLDEVHNLGEFVEIETSAKTEDSEEKVEELRDCVLKTLDLLDLKERERKSYLELLYPELH